MIYIASKKSALFHDETFRVFKRKSYFKSKTCGALRDLIPFVQF